MRFCVHSLILLEKKEAVNNTIILQYVETNLILTAFYSQAALLSLIVHSARVNSCQRYTCTLLQPQALASSLVLEIQVYTVITTGTCAIPCVRNTGVQGYNHRCLCQKYTCTLPLPGAGIRNTHVHCHNHRCLCQKYTCTLPQPQTLEWQVYFFLTVSAASGTLHHNLLFVFGERALLTLVDRSPCGHVQTTRTSHYNKSKISGLFTHLKENKLISLWQ